VKKVRAVFIDRDGTINVEKGYVSRIEDFEYLDGAKEALKIFSARGVKIFIITNQAGIAKGYYTEEDFSKLTELMLHDLHEEGIAIERVLYCPHHPEGTVPRYTKHCKCRKPGSELIENVMKEESLDKEDVAVIGDKNSDIESGERVGCKTYLVLTGYGVEHQWNTKATYVVNNLLEAAEHIACAEDTCLCDERTDAIILAGGLGTRLKEVVSDLPKALAPVKGKPFLDIILHSLNRYDFIRRVVIAVGYMSEKIVFQYGGEHPYRFEIVFSRERELLGTGGGIKRALKYTTTNDILVLNGDSYVDADLTDLCQSHMNKGADMTIVLKSVDDTSRFGRVSFGENSRIANFEEKNHKGNTTGPEGLINAGVYLFNRNIFDGVEDGPSISLERDLFPVFLEKKIYGYISSGKFIDIGTPDSFHMADSYLQGVQNE
jgi:D,D-heptose 1,7-bisphosphate phosphatase